MLIVCRKPSPPHCSVKVDVRSLTLLRNSLQRAKAVVTTTIRLPFDRATTIRQPMLRPYKT